MSELLGISPSALISGMLGVYALAFVAGGIYYLEQRVARIRDQFPGRGLLARATGYAALIIGVLASVSIGGHLLGGGPEFRYGALMATVAGVGFWVYRIHFDLTPAGRIRASVLGLVCAALSVLAGWWARSI
jgi:hypothetical protein